MNTAPEPPKKPELTELVAPDSEHDSKAALALAEAQEDIAELKDRQREERMAWIVLLVIVIDCFVLLRAENWSGPIIIGLLELAALSVIANRLGVDEFAALFRGALQRIASFVDKDS